jgi:hypothetical protein
MLRIADKPMAAMHLMVITRRFPALPCRGPDNKKPAAKAGRENAKLPISEI